MKIPEEVVAPPNADDPAIVSDPLTVSDPLIVADWSTRKLSWTVAAAPAYTTLEVDTDDPSREKARTDNELPM
jgi:hypothetical protein